ncbi:hypothetical protein G6O69_21415 [Pseudenhygromyxa sp. WMMC2535]|uniref:hypothetical protein n=1 Tax=Pseudenhygromyxa sp. WMMC2535 TaxID=2712867 RepID=UPI001557C473|nr:hypothetical protein [Pseudenhygromyxa sp. WMMC2535]NVB40413.1 hypothetical protein [Pseudenhygromyxa sp. WMMC2535]
MCPERRSALCPRRPALNAPRRVLAALSTLLVAAALALLPARARAHHVAGHGSSEGVRSINSLGSRGASASTRLMLLDEFTHTGSGLVPAQRNELTLLGEYAPIPALSFGAQLPFTVIAEHPTDAEDQTHVGYGDTRAFVRMTPYADKLIHRTLTFGVAASFPTRSFRTTVDAGRTWTLTPSLIFTRTYAKLYWQALGLATMEWRPAGVALDLSAGAQVGGRLLEGKIAVGGGVLVDVRTVNACRSVAGELAYCAGNRAGEQEREVGATRATALATFAWNIDTRWSLNLSLQAPFTPRRDFDFGTSVGVGVVF